jgi:hypothetical protein
MAQKPWLLKDTKEDNFIEVMGAKVFLKPLKYGKSRQAMSVAVTINGKGEVNVDSSLLATLRAVYQIRDWEITDENDEKLPITLETLDEKLSEEFVEELVTKVNEKQGTDQEVSKDEKKK